MLDVQFTVLGLVKPETDVLTGIRDYPPFKDGKPVVFHTAVARSGADSAECDDASLNLKRTAVLAVYAPEWTTILWVGPVAGKYHYIRVEQEEAVVMVIEDPFDVVVLTELGVRYNVYQGMPREQGEAMVALDPVVDLPVIPLGDMFDD